ncbi:sensor histidine kinase [Allorhizocola rhizosphaerae]|uniref:sensor histidine kinase n=1 Tax=Allorhizocola rhizosphaerae TaxID=1872709 RepID=UPI000E3DFA62|nr:histidine kinase [Allorhizocola rhizosphaerae]
MHELVRSVWDDPGAPHPPRRVWRDWLLVGVFALTVLLEVLLRTDLPWRAVSVGVAVALVPTLLWRRTKPLLMLTIAFVASALAPLFTEGRPLELGALVFFLFLPYSLYRWGSGRQIVLGSAVVAGNLGLAPALGQVNLTDTLGGMGVLSAACMLGVAVRYRVGARTRTLDQVKLLERERLARDLHDTVAHHVSAIAIRAQAGLATAQSRPDAAVEALRLIEAEATGALAEMRAMVRILRGNNQPAELAPSPRIRDLEGLAGRSRTGPEVGVTISGDVDGLHPSVGTAIYRLAQESVTNARRHARHATRIQVDVSADDKSVHLRVSDDGELGSARAPAPPGYGLIGMMERAGLLGGACQAGPNPDRGWTVSAVLPRTVSPA